ncbi:MAG TPA: PKD domain-containing protein, partial [Anaerolineae bacterium]|nr:PKD domain-containing protein [Anaerolineae bacterium]
MHTGKLRIVVFVIGLVALLSGAWLLTVPADGPAIAARQPAAAEAAPQPVQSASHQMQQTAAVRVQTSASLLGVGDTLVVTVTAANVESPLSAFQFDLTYNPSVLAYVGSEWGGFLESTGRAVACLDPIPAWGTVRLACASTGAEDGPTGGGVLAVLTFRTVSNGRSDLTPNNVLLPDTGRPPELQTATAEPASVSVCIPAGEVSISGPPTSTEGISVTFTATVNPVSGTASLPVTFTWQASGLETLVHYDALSDTATFTWTEAGPQVVTVTVANECGGVTASRVITIASACIPPQAVSLTAIPTGTTGSGVTFSASVSPTDGTTPVTYTWQASGQETITHRDGLSDTATFTWTEAGPQAVTVTVANECGGVTASQSINIEAAVQRIYLPLILRNAGGTQSAARPPLNRSLAYPLLALGLGMVLAGGGGRPFRRPRLPWQKIISIITLINLLAGLVPLPAAQTVRAVEEAARPPDIAPIPAPLTSVSPTAPLSTG